MSVRTRRRRATPRSRLAGIGVGSNAVRGLWPDAHDARPHTAPLVTTAPGGVTRRDVISQIRRRDRRDGAVAASIARSSTTRRSMLRSPPWPEPIARWPSTACRSRSGRHRRRGMATTAGCPGYAPVAPRSAPAVQQIVDAGQILDRQDEHGSVRDRASARAARMACSRGHVRRAADLRRLELGLGARRRLGSRRLRAGHRHSGRGGCQPASTSSSASSRPVACSRRPASCPRARASTVSRS